jgi:hypothetical protein
LNASRASQELGTERFSYEQQQQHRPLQVHVHVVIGHFKKADLVINPFVLPVFNAVISHNVKIGTTSSTFNSIY